MSALKGFGGVYERDGLWYLCFRFRGRRYRESTGVRSRDANNRRVRKPIAESALKKRITEIQNETFRPGASRITLADLREMHLADVMANGRKYGPRVENAFANLTRLLGAAAPADQIADRLDWYTKTRLAETIGPTTDSNGKPLKDADGEPIEPKHPAPGTVNRELACLKRAFNLAVRKRRLATTPYIERLAENNTRTRLPSETEVNAVLRELPGGLRDAMRLLSLVPWRVREALGLSWRQVDAEAGEIRHEAVEYKSGRVARVLPYSAHPVLATILADRRRLTDEWDREHSTLTPWVFWYPGEDANGQPAALPYAEYAGTWARACKRAKAANLHVHDLKRYSARALVRAGVDEITIMRLAGWRSRSMFDRYSIRNEQDLREGVQKLAAAPKTREA